MLQYISNFWFSSILTTFSTRNVNAICLTQLYTEQTTFDNWKALINEYLASQASDSRWVAGHILLFGIRKIIQLNSNFNYTLKIRIIRRLALQWLQFIFSSFSFNRSKINKNRQKKSPQNVIIDFIEIHFLNINRELRCFTKCFSIMQWTLHFDTPSILSFGVSWTELNFR